MKIRYLIAIFLPAAALAQTFSSGSTGADHDLTYTTPGTYVFDPKAFTPALDPDGDCIFNFTTITIASGVTVQFKGNVLNCPVVWLASGAVKIDGTLDLSGQNSFVASSTIQRTNTIPGSGGFGGGYPGVGANPRGAGLGPAGGAAVCDSNASYGSSGGFTGNQFLVPLVGGSGGGAGQENNAGGAGGGAILIASSVSISGAGSIKASGGNRVTNLYGGGGAGGAIRLVAPAIAITGLLNVSAGDTPCQSGSLSPTGVIRLEAFTIGPVNASGNLYTATPFGLFISSTGIPLLKVVDVGGTPVAINPTGTFTIPDVTVNSSAPLTFDIQASNIPLGTTATLTVFSENGPDQTIVSTPLAGSVASSTATASATLPPGFSKGFVTATWTQ